MGANVFECVILGHILWRHKDWYCESLWSAFSVTNVRAKTCRAVRDVPMKHLTQYDEQYHVFAIDVQ